MAIAAGFVGGRSIGSAGSLPVAEARSAADELPAPIRQRLFRRSLFGPHSLDAAGPADPYADPELGVVDRSGSSASFDPHLERAKIVVIVVDAGRAGPGLDPFVHAPLPLVMVVAPSDDDAGSTAQTLAAAGKTVVVDGTAASPAQVARLLHAGAHGVIGSLDESHAAAMMRALDRNAFVIDAALGEDDDLGRLARAHGHRVYQRDVIADARDDSQYVDFMLRDALAIAQRTGSAIVAVHARAMSFEALARFADRAQRDGADIVALTDLGR